MNAKEVLVALSELTGGNWDEILDKIHGRYPLKPEEVQKIMEGVPTPYLTLMDANEGLYPEDFIHSRRPPFVLYYQGNVDLLADLSKCVAIVGSREASPYGLSMAKKIAEGLAKRGYTIVSGLAKGVDAAALEAAVPYGRAIAVLGNGLGMYYPATNKDLQKRIASQGLLLSEYPYNIHPEAKNFPNRNRIIAYLSQMVVVAEAKPHSGTLITAAFAAEAGRDVGAVPYHADEDSACNRLIQDGAAMILSADDVIFQLRGSNSFVRK
ncbi:MAG: DNA-processing protein DprA [Candidatus Enteromonas sp.]|nr:DNA-processing protein DprA [Candidatus Enteromonas sp.]